MRTNHNATYDCLFVSDFLQKHCGSFTAAEIHLFVYLSCLLWMYRERALADWGYDFVSTELGAPYSQETDLAINELLDRGLLHRSQKQLCITERARDVLGDFSQLAIYGDRTECLYAACSNVVAFSVGMVGSALSHEPELSRSQKLPINRRLLEEPARIQLYEQFEALRMALNQQSNDLRMPSIVWLSALYQADETYEAQA